MPSRIYARFCHAFLVQYLFQPICDGVATNNFVFFIGLLFLQSSKYRPVPARQTLEITGAGFYRFLEAQCVFPHQLTASKIEMVHNFKNLRTCHVHIVCS